MRQLFDGGVVMLMCNMQKKNNRGFSMIEMLVVIVIILILSGMVLKVMTLVFGSTGSAKASGDIMKLENALAEYYSEYGQYPPGVGDPQANVEYEYENTNTQTMLAGRYFDNHPGEIGYRYGLVSHLWLRDRGGQERTYSEDTSRDRANKQNWAHFLDGVNVQTSAKLSIITVVEDSGSGSSEEVCSNSVAKISDPWGSTYYYICKPPYYSFEVWSSGADGINGNDDDIRSGGN